jgi:hypothetical protein
MIFWLLVGVAIGYFFRPQIHNGVQKVARYLRDNSRGRSGY